MLQLSITLLAVEGDGAFPIDMLRYSHCFPATELDSGEIIGSWEQEERRRRKVLLRRVDCHHKLIPSEIYRWKSFGWSVVGVGDENPMIEVVLTLDDRRFRHVHPLHDEAS
jgi:hypothetical protein